MSVKTFRERSPVTIGIISLLAIAIGVTFAFFIDRLPFIKQAYTVEAEFADAAGLNPENQVRVAGIKVGTVNSVDLKGDKVLVTMEIQNAIKVPDDSFAEIKLATILGTKFVSIEGAGSGPYLQDGDTIPISRTSVPYEIYQASNQGTAAIAGIHGKKLNESLVELATLVKTTRSELGQALSGVNRLGTGLNSRQDELRALLRNSNQLTGLLAEKSPTLVRLIDSSNAVLSTLAQKREHVQSLLESVKVMAGELASVIRENRGNLDSIFTKLDNALGVLNRNVKDLSMAFKYSGPSSRYFGSIFSQGRWGDIFTCALIVQSNCQHPPPRHR